MDWGTNDAASSQDDGKTVNQEKGELDKVRRYYVMISREKRGGNNKPTSQIGEHRLPHRGSNIGVRFSPCAH